MSAVPASLLLLAVLSYGLLAPWLGYYWDDWIYSWVSHSLGAEGLKQFLSWDRPFLGWLYAITTALLGETPLRWHILALLVRWAGAVAVWWSLRGLWPNEARWAAGISMLFLVYPGFTGQPIAWMYANALIPQALFIFSLGASIWSLRKRRLSPVLTVLGILSLLVSVFTYEYYVGLELIRPLFLLLVIAESIPDVRQSLRRAMIRWAPYLGVIAFYLTWRLAFFRSARPETDQRVLISEFLAQPVRGLGLGLYHVFTDVIQVCFLAWAQTLDKHVFRTDRAVWIAGMLGVASISCGIVLLALSRLRSGGESAVGTSARVQSSWARRAIYIGFFGVLVGQLPIWLTGRCVVLDSLLDRFSQGAMFGACIFLAGLISSVARTRRQELIIAGIVVGLATGFQFRNANRFRQDWETQKALFWQLSWRAPGLRPGTLLMAERLPILFPRSYSAGAATNFVYASNHSSPTLDYWFDILERDAGQGGPEFAEDLRIEDGYRFVTFTGTLSESLAVQFSPPSCLRVLDPSRNDVQLVSPLARRAQQSSHLDRIITDPSLSARPPSQIFGPEPPVCWCYYFEKADLARQKQDWQQIARLGDEAQRRGLKPSDASEWLPFLEGYTQVGRYQDARDIINKAVAASPALETALSALCRRLATSNSTDAGRVAFLAEVSARLSRAATSSPSQN